MLHEFNSRRFRARSGRAKHAVLCWAPYCYELAWGTQTFGGPHMRVLDADGTYGVELTAFFTTHLPVPEVPDHYVKQARVRGSVVQAPFTLVTRVHDRVEMVAEVPVGAYLAQNPAGELYAMSEAEFRDRYEDDEPA